jgi:hypothetical protein
MYMYVYICMYIYIHIHIYIYIYMYMYVFMYVLVVSYRLFIYHVKAIKQFNLTIKLNKKLNIHSKHVK